MTICSASARKSPSKFGERRRIQRFSSSFLIALSIHTLFRHCEQRVLNPISSGFPRRNAVFARLGFTTSAGIAPNMMLAKVASVRVGLVLVLRSPLVCVLIVELDSITCADEFVSSLLACAPISSRCLRSVCFLACCCA